MLGTMLPLRLCFQGSVENSRTSGVHYGNASNGPFRALLADLADCHVQISCRVAETQPVPEHGPGGFAVMAHLSARWRNTGDLLRFRNKMFPVAGSHVLVWIDIAVFPGG